MPAWKKVITSGSAAVLSDITISGVTQPEIKFNGSSDAGVDFAIRATPESLDFYEPEDSNKIHMQIVDDGGVDAKFGLKIGGTSVLSSGRALSNVTGNISMFTNNSGYITNSSDTSGNAGTATALATGRTFRTNLASTSTATFDGSGNVTPGVTGTLAVGNGGTGLTSISTLLNSNVTSVSGNAGTATALANARTISGVSFDGTSNITLDNSNIDNGAGYITSFTNTVDMGDGFVIEDGDGTEVTITENKEIKFVEGTGIDINWTDTSNGSDGDPYDLTITNTSPNVTQTTITGNAGTATTLETARNIAGVSFDGSANISLNNNAITNGAGYITGVTNISGNAGTATTLANARTIAGVSFDGSANISLNNNAITNGAGYTTNTGTTTAGNSQTFTNKGGNISQWTNDSGFITSFTNTVDMGDGFKIVDGDGTEVTITENKYIKFKEGTGIDINFTDTSTGSESDPFDITITNSSPNVTQTTITGNAGTATALETARNIAGVSFDGTGNISLNNNAITNGAGYITNSSLPTAVSDLDNDSGFITSFTNTVDMGDGFKVQDGDGTEVTITENKYIKFVEGTGIDINFTDTNGGGSSDPFDITITNSAPAGSTHLNSNTTATDVGLGNVTNESKSTMFSGAALTNNPTAPTQAANNDSTRIATTAYVQAELTALIGTAPSTLDTLGELSASLATDISGLSALTTTVGTKLAKSSNLSDLANAETARDNLGLGTIATKTYTTSVSNGSSSIPDGDAVYDHVTTRISGLTSNTGTVDTSGTPADNDFAKFTDANTIEGRSISETKSDLSLNNVENTALSTYTGNGGALDNQYITNGAGYTTNTGTTTAGNSQTFTNKGGNISQWTNDSGYTTNSGTTTPSNSQTFTNKGGNISQWTNDSGYITSFTNTVDMGDGFEVEDGNSSATKVTITENKKLKFINGTGIDIRFTDTSNGSSSDPFDITITNSSPNVTQTTITGNAGTATALQNARTISNVSFDGTSNITLDNSNIDNGAGYTTNTGTVDTSGTPADNDFAKFTDANTIEGRSISETKSDLSLNNVENTAISTFAGSANITTVGTIGTGTWNGTAIADAYLSSNTAHLSGTQTFSGAKTFSSLSSFTMDGNTITGIDDSGEFTDNDAHIMTSAGVNDRIATVVNARTDFAPMADDGRVLIDATDGQITTDSGFTYDSNRLTCENLTISSLQSSSPSTSETTGLVVDSSGNVIYREFGSNAFNSTSIPSAASDLSGYDEINISALNNNNSTTTMTNGSNNRVVTATGTTGLNGESALTFDGSTLTLDPSSAVGRFRTGRGTTSAPGLSFADDTNTGFYINSSTADTLYGSVGSSTRFQLNSTGLKVTGGALGVNVNASSTDGRIDASNDVVAYSSDKRLKENIKPIKNALDKVDSLSGFTFNWNELAEKEAGFDREQKMVGVFAQDVESILPEAVKRAPFDNDGDDGSISGENYLTVQYEKIVPLLIESIKELKEEIEELKRGR